MAWAYGPSAAPRKILVIGVIHGNEQAGLAITRALRRMPVPRGVQFWVLPELNPDGVAADTRQNAHGVDLNRNFPFRWRYSSDPTFDVRSAARRRSPRRGPRCGWCGGSIPR